MEELNLTPEQIDQEIELCKKLERIKELKKLLADEDFKTIKFIQGKLSQEDFDVVIQQCDEWRKEINRLEAEINGN